MPTNILQPMLTCNTAFSLCAVFGDTVDHQTFVSLNRITLSLLHLVEDGCKVSTDRIIYNSPVHYNKPISISLFLTTMFIISLFPQLFLFTASIL